MRFLLSVQYDGSNFYGFQRLNNERSVQGELEKALTKINKAEVTIKGAGRTDRGVHAKDQKCHCDLDISITEEGLKKALNSMLPQDIYITKCEKVSSDFHARFMCVKKTYKYIINMGEYNSIINNYVYNYGKKVNIKKLKKASKVLLGAHSFEAFVSGVRENYNSVIYNIKFKVKNDILTIEIEGKSFYRYMVRNIVGALINISEGKSAIDDLKHMVNNGKKKNYLTVPANGLYLEKIEY